MPVLRDARARADAADRGDHRRGRRGAPAGAGRGLSPTLVIAVGNPSRGDDALGPLCLERLEAALGERIARGEIAPGAIELLTDFQLQVELIWDLQGRARVIFVDASVTAPPPFAWGPVGPGGERPTTSHALSPAALLECHRRLLGPPPPSWVMAIRGERFELGEGLSPAAQEHLAAAVARLVEEI